ncbi:ATP-binding cassette domain-containing protein [Chitinophaga sp. G-6-1-13]|uniref:ATP-binding cassette domain-containing protein n=1 Tax=Chitinophaga fulva TaxID=2728842 RepID=A0A848GR77_9BACT|nr:ATP-binding cassette domain-containing protein [Chitinophaga fulva]NML40031.1 ATP-binding cassette domain-containing protein [Chitinophaga fulva]
MERSPNSIIETVNLNFGFSEKEPLLKNLSLKVEKGAIYGFLGPNGAGKTTTIRLLLGLLQEPAPSITLFGNRLTENRIPILSRIGSLIEQPSLYEHLSGRDNLEITRTIRKTAPERTNEVLALVKLTDVAHKKVKTYSMGMKQRLGVALALLSNPDLLILDEPVNGLDPAGIIETRELLLRLNKELGMTIFLSSHLLSEIEKMVTHVGIINKGTLIFQGTLEELKQINRNAHIVQIKTSNNLSAGLLLEKKYPVARKEQHLLEVPFENKEQVAAIAKLLMAAGLDIYLLAVSGRDIEHTFINFIAENNR